MATRTSDLSVAAHNIVHMDEVDEDAIIGRLNHQGIEVEYADLPRGMWGFYSREWDLVTLRKGMPRMYRLPTLMHECGHVARLDHGHQSLKVENAIDEDVALALINPADFAWAESRVGYHTGGLAHELELPKWVIRAYRRVLSRSLVA